ncbi:type IV pilus biogenesis protein PilP [Enterobacter sp. MW07]|nr:type IV pilus biogenesis protein PilP [Enterobacter sp. MW07]
MRQQSNFLPSAALLGLLIATLPAGASPVVSPQASPVATKGELEELQIKNILLQAKVQGAQLQRQLEENQSGSVPAGTPAPGTSVGYTSLPGEPTRLVSSNTRPVVLEISGRDRQLRATLALPSGQTLVVAPGNHIPGLGQTVKTITLAGVTLSDGSLLAFGG